MNYFKILRFLQRGDRPYFDVPINEQTAFLFSLGEAKNDIDRGYKQYLCQNYFVPKWKVSLFNCASAFILPVLVIFYLLKGLFIREGKHLDAMIEDKKMDEVIPIVVREKYFPDNSFWNIGSSFSYQDIVFIWSLIKTAPLHPYFVLKASMNVALYSDMIRRHSPSVMIQFGEFSFSSSILTDYCHRQGIKHIDIMHGEKLYIIRDSFFHYDECYVWDEHYVSLFCGLKAEPTQFRVAIPESMSIDTSKYQNKIVYADYKYYLAAITDKEMKSIVDSLAFVRKQRKTIKFRPHPRYTNMGILKRYVYDEEIEDPREVGILESISNLDFAVGSFTTVLSQAYFSGQKVLLDDLTYKTQYEKLKSMRYILAEKNLDTLSTLQ